MAVTELARSSVTVAAMPLFLNVGIAGLATVAVKGYPRSTSFEAETTS
jgi:hypothetical protein